MRSFANPEVLSFYRALPFNYYGSDEAQIDAVRRGNAVGGYPPVAALLASPLRLLEVGCGAGWFANGVKHDFPHCDVTAIDFNPVAVDRARHVAAKLGLDVHYDVADLFLYAPERPFDLVTSIGVLHHTDDCSEAIRRIGRACVRPGGHLFVGLYHRYGRKPFLDHFAALRADGASEDELFARFRALHAALRDETHLRSWFRDQVLHPHETQHTLEEIAAVLADVGFAVRATSINRFEPFDDVRALFALEPGYEEIGRQRLAEGRYFPGFFVVLAQKGG